MKYFWEAYRQGALDNDLAAFGDATGLDLANLTPGEFSSVVRAWAEANDIFVLIAKTKRGMAPVGVIAPNREAHAIFPHVRWFPVASHRNRVETIMKFVNDMRRESLVVIHSRLDEHGFWALLRDYGILKRRTGIGGIPGWYADGEACEIWTGK